MKIKTDNLNILTLHVNFQSLHTVMDIQEQHSMLGLELHVSAKILMLSFFLRHGLSASFIFVSKYS